MDFIAFRPGPAHLFKDTGKLPYVSFHSGTVLLPPEPGHHRQQAHACKTSSMLHAFRILQKASQHLVAPADSHNPAAFSGKPLDSRFQAILAMWGKMLNVEKARVDKIYGNDKLYPLIVALGAGIGNEFNIDKLRYHKIVIMADADVDGSHIRTLLLTFFFRYMRPLIENGYVYSAVPPLFKLSRGKQQRVAYSDEERDAISRELRGDNPDAKVDISRFKGLGEMDPHELWETTMDPERRTLRRITLEDAQRADEIFTVLMGDEVEPRRAWIETKARYVVNLDY